MLSVQSLLGLISKARVTICTHYVHQVPANQRPFRLLQTPRGIVLAPVRDGEVLTAEQFNQLDARIQAGVPTEDGIFPQDTIYQAIFVRLKELAEKMRGFNQQDESSKNAAVDNRP